MNSDLFNKMMGDKKGKYERIPMGDLDLRQRHLHHTNSPTGRDTQSGSIMIPMEIEEPKIHTPKLQQRISTHIKTNKMRYAAGAGISAGIGAGIAGIVHASGNKLADIVKKNRQDEFPIQRVYRNELMEKLNRDIPETVTQAHVDENKANVDALLDGPNSEWGLGGTWFKKHSTAYDDNKNTGHDGWINEYPHVGPGNKILPTANNPIDNIARQHDIAYTNAKTRQDIQTADEAFIEEMKKTSPDSWKGTGVKLASIAGIKTKSVIENTLGKTLYPAGLRKYILVISSISHVRMLIMHTIL